MRFARDYRLEAAERTKPQAGTLAIITLIYILITALISLEIKTGEVQNFNGIEIQETIQPLSFISIFVSGAFALSWLFISKKVHLGQKAEIKDLFHGFKDFSRSLVAFILMDIYLVLWALCSLGIMAIVKSYSYSMTYFLLQENPGMTANEAITESRRLMNGNKWRLFCLDFSYIGWHLLSILTLGILQLWVTPRVEVARYIFMKEVYEEAGNTVSGYEENVVLTVDDSSKENVEVSTEE